MAWLSGGGTGAGGEAPTAPPPTTPPPTPTDEAKRWTIGAADFPDDGVTYGIDTTHRSEPYAWDRITGDNVRVSIDGKELPLTSTAYQPAFADDDSGAEWALKAEVRAGAVVLALTAQDQRRDYGEVGPVTITNGGSGYTSAPTVTFAPAPAGGTTATGAATAADRIAAVTISNAGSGYTLAPAVSFTGGGGEGAAGAAATGNVVESVTVDNGGSGYTSVPTVSFSGGGGSGAAATAAGPDGVASVTVDTGGSGYTSVPTVSFSGGSGSGAAGTAATRLAGRAA